MLRFQSLFMPPPSPPSLFFISNVIILVLQFKICSECKQLTPISMIKYVDMNKIFQLKTIPQLHHKHFLSYANLRKTHFKKILTWFFLSEIRFFKTIPQPNHKHLLYANLRETHFKKIRIWIIFLKLKFVFEHNTYMQNMWKFLYKKGNTVWEILKYQTADGSYKNK